MLQAILTRRQTLAEVRSCVRCHYYNSYIIGLQWNPGKGEYDKEFGNVTGYLTEPDGSHYTLAFRVRLTENYQQEVDQLVASCKEYVGKLIAIEQARLALDRSILTACDHQFPL
jgi:hypothetical protein